MSRVLLAPRLLRAAVFTLLTLLILSITHAAPASGTPQFTPLVSFAGSDGANPTAALIAGPDGNFYGTASNGGANGVGTVFKITPAGTLTTLYTFSALDGNGENSDGANPFAALLAGPDGNYYGSTIDGGANGSGTVFKITPAGTLTTLYTFSALDSSFENSDGANPRAALIAGSDGDFYGSTIDGGANGVGTVFKITPAGTLTTLYTFSALDGNGENSDGANPRYALVVGPDGNYYGSTTDGGANGSGTVFKITPAGTLTTLYTFSASNSSFENSDGAYPFAPLVVGPDSNFYGTTYQGGANGYGTVFKITPVGALTTLYTFSEPNSSFENSDGANPRAALVAGSDGDFYGTASNGGASGTGTVFKITPTGTLTTLYTFSALDSNFENSDGAHPFAPLVVGSDGNFYGTTTDGGANADGTVFKLAGPPTITGFTPTSGPIGTSVTITGTNLTGTTILGFQGQHAKTFTVNAAGTQITTAVPQGAITGPIAVLVNGIEVKSATKFTVEPPTITSFTPASGPVGTTVTITGMNLTGTTVVGFQGKHATSFTVNAAGTQIMTTVPSGAQTGPVAVLTSGIEAKSPANFTVIPPPAITSFTPASGSVGTTVVITGTNLTGVTVVGFQGQHAKTFTVNGAGTQITATVPAGAATGPIAVLTPGGEAKSPTNFTVTP